VNTNPQSTSKSPHAEVLIIGAGAAGLLCAIECAEKGLSVLLLEKNEKPGMKILVSGGGRCNFTNLGASPVNYISNNPHFCKSALAKYRPEDFLQRMAKHSLTWVEKKADQLFSAQGAKTLLNCLLKDLTSSGATCLSSCGVEKVLPHGVGYQVISQKGIFNCNHLVVATGGLSWPKLGVSDLGYRIASQFNHLVTKRTPGLVPLLWKTEEQQRFSELAGLSTNARIQYRGQTFADDLLFTHQGLSGPLILQISSYWQRGDLLKLEWCDSDLVQTFFKELASNLSLQQFLSQFHPKRWIKAFISPALSIKKASQLSTLEKETLHTLLCEWPFTPHDHAGYAKAEVTLGGVDTSSLSSKTMESTLCPNLYFIGEVVDVTGQLGGFNFQWAWSSAAAAARAIAGF